MRVLSNADVEQILTIEECLSALETAYVELARGRAANRPRNHTYFPVEDPRHPGFRYRFKSQEGGNLASGVWALRITSDMAGVETLPSGVQRRRLLPLATNDSFVGLVVLFSLHTLEPLAVIHDSVVQKMRVGATSALGIRELANPDVTVAALFGSGWQAGAHLDFLLHARPTIEEIRVFSPTASNREAFAREWARRSGRRVVAASDPNSAVVGADVVTCATAAMEPVLDGASLGAGTHVTCITNPDGTAMRRELDDLTYDRADVLVVTSREQIDHDKQYDILGPVERGLRDRESIVELGELLAGMRTGRTDAGQLTVFANNTGMGLQFAAVGARVLELADKHDLGHVVPTEWFVEDTTP